MKSPTAARKLAAVFAGMVIALAGSSMARATEPDIAVDFTPHCGWTRVEVVNNTGESADIRVERDGDLADSTTALAGGDDWGASITSVPPEVLTVLAKLDSSSEFSTVDTFTATTPARCGEFPATFDDTCTGVDVSVKNEHGSQVYIRILDDGAQLHAGFLDDEATFSDSFEVEDGSLLWVETTVDRLIDTVKRHRYALPAYCAENYPTVIEDTCDGVKVTVTNNSDEAVEVGIWKRLTDPSGWELLTSFNVGAGDTESASVELADGVKINAVISAFEIVLGAHVHAKPDTCDTPELPVTGSNISTLAVGGLAVLIAGGVILFGLRRWRRREIIG